MHAVIPEPKTMVAIKDLSLAAKTTIDGFMSGINKSRLKGDGAEFSQYRNYLPGDDLRSLDWKIFARTGKYYIKQSEPDRTISVQLMIDASASMNHSCGSYTKLQYGRYLAACLALLSYRQGDRVGLSLINDQGIRQIEPDQHGQQLQRIYDALSHMDAKGHFESAVAYKQAGQSKAKSLMIFLTDFYEHNDEIMRLLKLLAGMGNEVVLMQLMAENELQLQFKGFDALEDLETGKQVLIQHGSSRQRQVLDDYLDGIKGRLLKSNISYCLVNANTGPETVLLDFLKRRTLI
ncbi:DUF58 domain-containing protein [Olivibacter sitiensis]|uniref:DUF58 domain-containing protein n=1 Tax=Olivibacter sitiensis TaxID=376470 RepID=UPI00056A8465|nr:DUF58 domain-containing protein [Olivibacter sitiensis]